MMSLKISSLYYNIDKVQLMQNVYEVFFFLFYFLFRIYNLFALKNSKILQKCSKSPNQKKLWGSIKTERSIFDKNQVQVFPSHIAALHISGFRNKK